MSLLELNNIKRGLGKNPSSTTN